MTAQELLDILNNKDEVPKPENAKLYFYLIDKGGNEISLKLTAIGMFPASTNKLTVYYEMEDEQ